MIQVTRLDGSRFTINSDLIEFIEATPDTVLTLITHKKLIIREGVDEVVRRVVAYKQRIHHYPPTVAGACLAPELGPVADGSGCPYRAPQPEPSAGAEPAAG